MTKIRALIGHTGFVGSAIDDASFGAHFNSKNIQDAANQQFSEVVCAGVQAVKWWANKNPVQDWEGIRSLLTELARVKTDRFVLVSTVDVFGDSNGADEGTHPVPAVDQAYGRHRRAVEEFVLDRFGDRAVIVRLPGLFGPNLKKNLIFDLLEGRDVSGFNPQSSFQFYDITQFAKDLRVIEKAELSLVHLAVEPVKVIDIARALGAAGDAFSEDAPCVGYDMHTRHGDVWGQSGRYIESADSAIERIKVLASRWPTA